MKWTKKAIKELQQRISSFWVCNRPLGDGRTEMFDAAFTGALATKRVEIVLAGLAQNLGISMDRSKDYRRTAEHYGTIEWAKGTPHGIEMVERFSALAEDEEHAQKYLERLVARVQAEGLPPEVTTYDPRRRYP